MKTRSAICLSLGMCFTAFMVSWGATPVAAEGPLAATAVGPAVATLNGEEPKYSYVGTKKCKKCHIQLYKSWAETRMAKAFDILKPGEHKEAKEKFKVDITKDFTADEKCIKCHTVGFGKPGGYVTPDPNNPKAVRKAKKLQNIGCECCHGPGSGYVKVFTEIFRSKRKYKVEELYAVGLQKIDESTCKTCHNQESPTIDANYVFNFEERKKQGMHKHFPLKQREP